VDREVRCRQSGTSAGRTRNGHGEVHPGKRRAACSGLLRVDGHVGQEGRLRPDGPHHEHVCRSPLFVFYRDAGAANARCRTRCPRQMPVLGQKPLRSQTPPVEHVEPNVQATGALAGLCCTRTGWPSCRAGGAPRGNRNRTALHRFIFPLEPLSTHASRTG